MVHSKIMIVDDTLAMYKTGDMYDNCTSNMGNMEHALCLTSPRDVQSLYTQCMCEFRKHRSLFVKHQLQARSFEGDAWEWLITAYVSLNLPRSYYAGMIVPFENVSETQPRTQRCHMSLHTQNARGIANPHHAIKRSPQVA